MQLVGLLRLVGQRLASWVATNRSPRLLGTRRMVDMVVDGSNSLDQMVLDLSWGNEHEAGRDGLPEPVTHRSGSDVPRDAHHHVHDPVGCLGTTDCLCGEIAMLDEYLRIRGDLYPNSAPLIAQPETSADG